MMNRITAAGAQKKLRFGCLLSLPVGTYFIPVGFGYVEHAETFAVFFANVLVVHFVCPANGANVYVIAAGKPFEALVNNDIMHQEIRKAVHGNTEANGGRPIHTVLQTEHDAEPAGNGEDEEEGIVLFKHMATGIVVVFVEVPQKTMHHVFMRGPGNAFHGEKCTESNENPK